ncbi:hypothetical protein NNG64_14140 [Bacillus siamensis]|uniref:Uncharacterized protein n=1 Tax=Bacillus siamensis TaxID=659243 RepID=A0AAI8HLX5_9BACI|nr:MULTISPECIES: hypothetical protein [Bacillus]AME07795.1 hypothetical protein AUL54_16465 [Bacillus sp. SDLI1]AUJ76404.1 hypothetical protein CWD84_06125 [Bacillus siamensis]UUA83240.1 hypothetical protein NNG64_14140 [Bacillus siamensis]
MNRKKILTGVLAASIASGTVLPTSSAFAKSIQAPSYEQLNKDFKITSEVIKDDGKLVEIQYAKQGEKHKAVLNAKDHTVKVDGEVQKGLNYDFDEKKAEIANGTQNSSATDTFTTMAAKPKAGYKYVGTVSGHTKESKNAITLVGSLFGTIPGLGWGAKAAGVLFAYWTKERIPDAYYKYDLYEKGAMTNSWYQYTTTQFFEDKAHKKPMGKPWTSSPTKIDLPNS